jgi:hypothetical protein
MERMKVRHEGRGARVTSIGLLSITGLLFAVVPAQALARKRGAAKPPRMTQQEKVDAKRTCAESYKEAQGPRKSGQLIEAKELFGKCAKAACGTVLMKRCTVLYKRMDAEIPSILPIVTDTAGVSQPLNEGKIEMTMDGQSLISKDGRAIFINPGQHEFTFSNEKTVFATQKVMVVHGQRNLKISVSLPASAAAQKAAEPEAERASQPKAGGAEPEAIVADVPLSRASRQTAARQVGSTGRVRWPTYALGGIGVLSLGSAGLLTYWGRNDNKRLMESCATNCKPSSVHHIRMLYLASDIALGAGVVALAASTWLYLRSRGSEKATPAGGPRISLFDVQTTPSGAFATVQGAF